MSNRAIDKAIVRWLRFCEDHNLIPQQPCTHLSDTTTHRDGSVTVTLRNSCGLLATCEVSPKGRMTLHA